MAFFKAIEAEASVFTGESDDTMRSVEDYAATLDDPRKALYWRMTAEFGLMYEQMVRDWCARCEGMLETMKGAGEHEEAVRKE